MYSHEIVFVSLHFHSSNIIFLHAKFKIRDNKTYVTKRTHLLHHDIPLGLPRKRYQNRMCLA